MRTFKQLIAERYDQVEMLGRLLANDRITNLYELDTWLSNNRAKAIGKGARGHAFHAALGDWVLKVSRNDGAYNRFAGYTLKERAWEQNSLFPVIKSHAFLSGETDAVTVTVIEKLTPLTDLYSEMMGEYAQPDSGMVIPEFLHARFLGTDMSDMAVEYWNKFKEVFNVDDDQMADFFDRFGENAIFGADCHRGNLGLRANRQLVLFDPLSGA